MSRLKILVTLLIILVISISSLVYAQESEKKSTNWFQKVINFFVSLFKPSAEISSETNKASDDAQPVEEIEPIQSIKRNLTPVESAEEPAQPVEIINESGRHGIYINASEFYKDRVRSWSACYGFECFTPSARKGQDSIDYFRSLNFTDDYIYVIMQFEAPGGDPSRQEMNILAADNITLFEYHGDHSYYAKAPRAILETKSYDFVRWIGIGENASWKVYPSIKSKTFGKNCSGYIKQDIIFYQKITDIHNYQSKIDLFINLSKSVNVGSDNIVVIETDVNNIYKIASFNFVQSIWPFVTPSICPPRRFGNCGDDPFANVTCDS